MAKRIGAIIALDGEKEFKSSVRNINAEMKTLQSELNLTKERFSGQSNTLEALRAKYGTLSEMVEKQTEKQKKLKEGLTHAKESQDKVGKGLDELRKKYQEAETKMQKMEDSSESTTDELEQQKQEMKELADAIKRGENNYELAGKRVNAWQKDLNDAETELIRMNRELDETGNYMKEAENRTDKCASSIDAFGNQMQQAKDDTDGLGKAMDAALGNLFADAIEKCFTEIIDLSKQAVSAIYEVGTGFESQMSTVAALSGATGGDLDSLNEKAKEIGATTKFTATEAGEGLEYMALAGWNVDEMLEGIDGVISATAASGLELSEVSDILTDSMTAFGDSAADANRYADVLAETQAKSNTTISALGEAYTNCASTAGSYGYSLESVSAALGVMANAGIKGSTAGTNLSTIMTRLATNTNGARDQLETLGVEFYNEDGSARDFNDVITELCDAMSGMTTEEKASISTTIAGKNAQKSLNAILNQGADAYNELYGTLLNCDGAAQEMADTVNDNLSGKLTIMQSSLEAVGLSIYEHFQEPLKEAVEEGTEGFETLNDAINEGELSDNLDRLGEQTGELTKKAISFATDAVPKVTNGVSWIIDHGDAITSILEGIGAGVAAIAVKSGVTKAISVFSDLKSGITDITGALTKMTAANAANTAATEAATVAQEGLNAAQAANTIGIIVAGLVAAGTAIYSYVKKTQEAEKETLGQAQEVKALSTEYDNLKSSMENSRTTRQDTVDGVEAEYESYQVLTDKLYDLADKENKSNEEKALMKTYVDQLNEAIPGLNLAIDENTGKLNLNRDAIENNIQSLKQQAIQEAAQSALTDTLQERMKAEMQLKKLEEERRSLEDAAYKEVQENFANASSGVQQYELSQMNATKTLKALKEQEDEVDEKIADANQTIEDSQAEYENWEEVVKSTSNALDDGADSTEAVGDAANETEEDIEALEEELEQLEESVKSSIDASLDAFNEFDGGTEISTEQVLQNLTSQVDGIRNWSDNMTTLAGAAGQGMTQEFYDYLLEMGPESANLVQSLVDSLSSDAGMFAEVCQKWTEGMNLEDSVSTVLANAEQALSSGSAGVGAAAASAASTVASSVETELDNAAEKATESGAAIGKGTAEGIASAGTAVQEAAGNATETAGQTGTDMMTSMAAGIAVGSPNVSNAVTGALTQANTAAASMQAQFQTTGSNMMEGMRAGIESKASEVAAAAAAASSAALQAAKDAVEIKSPSKKFKKEVGEQIGKGMALGIKSAANLSGDEAEKMSSNIYKKASAWLKEYKVARGASLDDEIYYWQQVKKKLKEGTDAYEKAAKKIETLKKNKTTIENYNLSGNALSAYKTYYNVSAKAEVDYWNKVRKQYKEGTAERLEADQKYYEAKESYNEQLEELNEDYYENCKEVNEKLADDVQELTDTYNDAVSERKNAIYSSFGLFDQFESTSASGATLLYNLKTQVAGYADWEQQLEELSGKGLSDGLMEELKEMGPEASASIHALNSLTAEQLAEYDDLWKQKNELAQYQAEKDEETLKKTTEEQIAAAKAAAQQELDAYKTEYEQALSELNAEMEAPLKTIASKAKTWGETTVLNYIKKVKKTATSKDTTASLKTVTSTITTQLSTLESSGTKIGKDTLQGILDGLTNKKKINSSAKEMVEMLKEAVKKAADIHSPSRLFKKEIGVQISAGVAEGITDDEANVNQAGENMVKSLLDSAKSEMEAQQASLAQYADSINGTEGITKLNQMVELQPVQQVTATVDNSELALLIENLAQIMQDGFEQVGNMQLVMDTGALVGQTGTAFGDELARMYRRKR